MISVSVNSHTGEVRETTDGMNINEVYEVPRATPLYQLPTGVMTQTIGGKLQTQKVATVSGGDLGIKSGILSTASNNGTVVRHTNDVKDTTLVTIGGVSMSAKAAARAGLLNLDSHGNYSEGGTVPGKPNLPLSEVETQGGTEVEAQTESVNMELTSDLIESSLAGVSDTLGGFDAVDRHAMSAIAGLVKGDTSHAAKQFGTAMGEDPAHAQAYISAIYSNFEEQSAQYLSKSHGVDGVACLKWAADNLSESERMSMAHRIYRGYSEPLDTLAKKYSRAMNQQ
jgi:hypothetical protein